MNKNDYSTEQFGHFVENLKESFWGDLQGQVKQMAKEILEVDSEQRMEEYLGLRWYERPSEAEPRVAAGTGSMSGTMRRLGGWSGSGCDGRVSARFCRACCAPLSGGRRRWGS